MSNFKIPAYRRQANAKNVAQALDLMEYKNITQSHEPTIHPIDHFR
jgi:hypothetical protein